MRRLLPCCLKGSSDGESERAPLTSPLDSRHASFSSGSSSTPPPLPKLKSQPHAQPSTAADGDKLVGFVNAFGARLFVQLGNRVEGNLCAAPLSVALTRCQVKVGASDGGREEMARVLQLLGFLKPTNVWWAPAVPIERAKRAAYEQSLLDDTRVPFGVELHWNGEHADRLDRVYMTMGLLSEGALHYWCEMREAHFSAPECEVERFNDYVRSVSGGLVPQAISTVHSGTRLLLYTADHFRGELRVPFNSRLSVEREFEAAPGRTLRTRMLVCQHMRVPFARYMHPRFRLSLASLPLRLDPPSGLALELGLILPDDHDDFNALQTTLNSDPGRLCELLNQLSGAERADVSVVLPPLRFQSLVDFASPLSRADPSAGRAVQATAVLRQCHASDASAILEELQYSMRAIHFTSLDIKFSRVDGVKLDRASSSRSRHCLHCERPFYFVVWTRTRPEKGTRDVISACPLYIVGRYCTPPPASSTTAQSTSPPSPVTAENEIDLPNQISRPLNGTQ